MDERGRVWHRGGFQAMTLSPRQLEMWKAWPDLQKAFPSAEYASESQEAYIRWWASYYPGEAKLRDLRIGPKVQKPEGFDNLPTKVLVVTPTTNAYDYCWNEYWKGIQEMEGEFDVLIIENSDYEETIRELPKRIEGAKHPTTVKRWYNPRFANKLYSEAQEKLAAIYNFVTPILIEGKYTHMMMMESDVTAPPDTVNRLLAVKQPIVQALMMRNGIILHGYIEGAGAFGGNSYPPVQPHEWEGKEILKIEYGSIGCCLFERWVVEQIKWKGDAGWHPDMWLAKDCKILEVPIYLVPGIVPIHWRDVYKDTTPLLTQEQKDMWNLLILECSNCREVYFPGLFVDKALKLMAAKDNEKAKELLSRKKYRNPEFIKECIRELGLYCKRCNRGLSEPRYRFRDLFPLAEVNPINRKKFLEWWDNGRITWLKDREREMNEP